MIFSEHILKRVKERGIEESWIVDTIKTPDFVIEVDANETHYFKKIAARDKCLKVVLNPQTKVLVTAFFDRKQTKKGCKND